MKEVYFISGLGADRRLLEYLDLKNVHVHYISWIAPEKNETWEAYAQRLTKQIIHPRPILIGVSMGGMMAIEINKIIDVEKTILISSSKTRREIPPYFHLLQYFKVHRWINYKWITRMGLFVGQFLFGPTNKAEKKLLKEIIQDTDETFFKWAWDRVANWRNQYIPPHLIHIHGTQDHMLPILFIKPDYKIKGGTHLMVFHKAEEISKVINKYINGKRSR